MVIELLNACGIGVVAFFVLLELLIKVIRRISERKHKAETASEDADKEKSAPESFPSEG